MRVRSFLRSAITALAVLPAVSAGPAHAARVDPPRARVPVDVPIEGLMELARQGEVALLPVHDQQPFNGVVLTRYDGPCSDVEHAMLDVESYPRRWNVKKVVVKERTATSVAYEMYLGIPIAPALPGRIDHKRPGEIAFHDVETGADFIWTLVDFGGGCQMTYSLKEAVGKTSGWVDVIKTFEKSAVDAANFGVGFTSARGFTRPYRTITPTASAEQAFALLARHGTALRVVRGGDVAVPRVITRRAVTRSAEDVARDVRNRASYRQRIAVLSDIDTSEGNTTSYSFAAAGGRVRFDARAVEAGSLDSPEGLRITETITSGDIKRGSWTWTLRRIPGGTDVELAWDVDIVSGSAVMNALSNIDPACRESLSLHLGLALIANVVGGTPIGAQTLAVAP